MTPADRSPPIRLLLDQLRRRGWSPEWIQAPFAYAPGRVALGRSGVRRLTPPTVDLLLKAAPDLPLAVVAVGGSARKPKASGLPWVSPAPADSEPSRAVEEARALGLPFAFEVREDEVREWDLARGRERVVPLLPRPAHLLRRVLRQAGVPGRLLTTRSVRDPRHPLRHDQLTAVNRALLAIEAGGRRLSLIQAEGTGRSHVAFQIAHRLWRAGWNARGDTAPTRILVLAPSARRIERMRSAAFAPFGDERGSLVGGLDTVVTFATPDETVEAVTHGELVASEVDLVLVDSCESHEACQAALNALDESVWLALRVTAPDEGESERFGEPLACLDHKHAVDQGLIAPYVLRHVPAVVEDSDVDKALVTSERNERIARYVLAYLRRTDPFAKTVVACVDHAHAERLREAFVAGAEQLGLPRTGYAFVVQDDDELELDRFRDVDQPAPVVALVPGRLPDVALPAVKNLALARGIGSSAELAEWIGRLSRLRPDCDKWFLTVLDFAATETTNSGVADFARLGDPDSYVVQPIDQDPEPAPFLQRPADDEPEAGAAAGPAFGAMLNFESAGQILKSSLGTPGELRERWSSPEGRSDVLKHLSDLGIDLRTLAERAERPDADPLDLLVATVFGTPIWSREERARALSTTLAKKDEGTRVVLERALGQYVDHGLDELELPGVLGRRALRELGGVDEVTRPFEGVEGLKQALRKLQRHMYRRDDP